MLDLDPVRHALERGLGLRVGEQVAERADDAFVSGDGLLERARAALRDDEVLDLPAREVRLVGQLPQRRLLAAGLQVLAASVLDPRELARRPVGEDDRAGQLGDELLHGLPDPPRRVGPERRALLEVVAAERAQQADDALLHELAPVDGRGTAVDAGHAADERHERFDQLIARRVIAALGGPDQLALAREREPRAAGRATSQSAATAMRA